MKFGQRSITGQRGENQDAILEPFQVDEAMWCGIADGVGSASLGGVAARISLDEVRCTATADVQMTDVFANVSRRLSELASEQDNPKSLSTTLSVLCLNGKEARVGHVGDTRITHYRNGSVMARTKDQTEVQKLLDKGVLSKHQARRYPRRNVLLSAMSAGHEYDLFESSFPLESGDRILLTSDGFHSKLRRRRLSALSVEYPRFDDYWRRLEELISRENLDDDASCLAIEIE